MILSLIAYIITGLIEIYVFLILVYCILSWIPRKGKVLGTIDYYIARIVEPYLNIFRKIMPPVGGIDFSPILAILVLELVVMLI